MEILICVKQVPDDSVEVRLDPKTCTPDISKVAAIVNAFDGYALEMATRLKEAQGGSITAVSIGSDKAKDALRNCLSVGADKAYLVSDEKFDGADTLATSYILSKAMAKIEELKGSKFDLVFCGKEATDGATGQVGPQLAEQLGLPQVTYSVGVDVCDAGIVVKKETEEGYNMVETSIPCVVVVTKPEYDPRYPTMRSKMAARKMEIPTLTAADLGDIDIDKAGLKGSPAKVVKVFEPAKKEAGIKIKEETAAESAIKAVGIMAEAKLI